MKTKKLPSRDYLISLFDYDPITGDGWWKVSRCGAKKGKSIIQNQKYKYHRVTIDNVCYLWYRVLYKMHYGDFDENLFIDHIAGVEKGHHVDNLRLVTQKENLKNTRLKKNNTSGVTGVYWDSRSGKWCAAYRLNGKNKYVGYFHNIDEAEKAIKEARETVGFHPSHGRSS